MKDQFLKIAAAILILTGVGAPGFADEAPKAPAVELIEQSDWVMGDVWFEQVRTAYKQGDFDDFLQKIDARYRQGVDKNEWQKLFDPALLKNDPDAQLIQKQAKAFGAEFDALRHKRNEQFKALAAQHQGETVAKIVQSLLPLSPEQKNAVEYINQLDSPEISLIDEVQNQAAKQIVTEYHVKQLIVTTTKIGSHEWAGGIEFNKENNAKFRVVLELEKYSKLLNLAKSYPDTFCSEKILIAAETYPKIAAEMHDRGYLIDLESGKRAAKTEAEKQAALIMKNFFEQKQALFN